MAFSASTIVVDGQGTPDSTTASVTVVPSGRTIDWEIPPEDLGCSLSSHPDPTSTNLDSGDKGKTIMVRAKDSEIEDCYLDHTLDIIGVKVAGPADEDDVCLLYTGNYPFIEPDSASPPKKGQPMHGDEPTNTITATGSPSGGTYSWEEINESGCGMFEIVSGGSSDTVEIIGARASVAEGDADLRVTYTLDGAEVENTLSWTVSKPDSLIRIHGKYEYTSTWKGQSFYFQVRDEFDNTIEVKGIPCWEKLALMDGVKTAESYYVTATYDDDEDYEGEIVFKDRLQVGSAAGFSEEHQTFYVGGWAVSPMYVIELDWTESPGVSRTATSSPPP